MPRVILAAVAAWLVGGTAANADPPEPAGPCSTVAACRAQVVELRRAVDWQRSARHRLERHLRRVHRPDITEAAELAARAIGVDAGAMLRVAACESQLDPFAVNPSSGARGAWQFLASTWRHTPFAAWSPSNPMAAALATALIVRREGWRQWTCGWAAG